jgi:hypothetical protein
LVLLIGPSHCQQHAKRDQNAADDQRLRDLLTNRRRQQRADQRLREERQRVRCLTAR